MLTCCVRVRYCAAEMGNSLAFDDNIGRPVWELTGKVLTKKNWGIGGSEGGMALLLLIAQPAASGLVRMIYGSATTADQTATIAQLQEQIEAQSRVLAAMQAQLGAQARQSPVVATAAVPPVGVEAERRIPAPIFQ